MDLSFLFPSILLNWLSLRWETVNLQFHSCWYELAQSIPTWAKHMRRKKHEWSPGETIHRGNSQQKRGYLMSREGGAYRVRYLPTTLFHSSFEIFMFGQNCLVMKDMKVLHVNQHRNEIATDFYIIHLQSCGILFFFFWWPWHVYALGTLQKCAGTFLKPGTLLWRLCTQWSY